MQYTVRYELDVAGEVIESEMVVEADSEAHAVEHCGNVLDQQYDDATLLECEVVG